VTGAQLAHTPMAAGDKAERHPVAHDLRADAAAWAERTAVEQGLPAKVEDVAVLRRVLYLLEIIDADGKPIE
jgi:hypothetical protein